MCRDWETRVVVRGVDKGPSINSSICFVVIIIIVDLAFRCLSEAFLGEVLFCPVLSFYYYCSSIYLCQIRTVGLGWGLVNEFEKYFSMRFWVRSRSHEKGKKGKKGKKTYVGDPSPSVLFTYLFIYYLGLEGRKDHQPTNQPANQPTNQLTN